jgi:hypothetical protein
MGKELVISSNRHETKVAILEDDRGKRTLTKSGWIEADSLKEVVYG